MPQRGLHEVDRRPTVEAVRGVGVPQPVRRDLAWEPCLSRRGLHGPVDRARIEHPTLPRAEHRLICRPSRQVCDLLLPECREHLSPGIVRRTLDQQLVQGKEPTKAAVRGSVVFKGLNVTPHGGRDCSAWALSP